MKGKKNDVRHFTSRKFGKSSFRVQEENTKKNISISNDESRTECGQRGHRGGNGTGESIVLDLEETHFR